MVTQAIKMALKAIKMAPKAIKGTIKSSIMTPINGTKYS